MKKRIISFCLAMVMALSLCACGSSQSPDSAKKAIKNANVGDTIQYGKYQNEDIEWIVIDKTDSSATLISKKIVACQPFDFTDRYDDEKYFNWSTCSLRKWLNNDFINETFSEEQQSIITETELKTVNYSGSTETAAKTSDKIYILSLDEVRSLLNENTIRAEVTEYVSDYASNTTYNDIMQVSGIYGGHVLATDFIVDGYGSYMVRTAWNGLKIDKRFGETIVVADGSYMLDDGHFTHGMYTFRPNGVRPAMTITFTD